MRFQAVGSVVVAMTLALVTTTAAQASVSPGAHLGTYSWDPGLYAVLLDSNGNQFGSGPSAYGVDTWGARQTAGFWGTGPVNYQAGATAVNRAAGSGSLSFTMQGGYCPGGSAQCQFGQGTGYKGVVQLWNDSSNYIAFGVIHDPAVSPSGTTLMVEGAGSLGRSSPLPVGGYWSPGALPGAGHTVTVTWGAGGVSFTLDGAVTLGSYPVMATDPSISFLGAARGTNDSEQVVFNAISCTGCGA